MIGAWKAACKVVGGKVEIPAGKEFMVKAVTLQGPCKEETVVQIEGTLVAPTKIGSWPKSSLFQWLNFKWVSHVTIQGSGTLDARGYNWWNLDNYQTQVRFYFQVFKQHTRLFLDLKPGYEIQPRDSSLYF